MLNTKMAVTITVEMLPKTLNAVPKAPSAENKFKFKYIHVTTIRIGNRQSLEIPAICSVTDIGSSRSLCKKYEQLYGILVVFLPLDLK